MKNQIREGKHQSNPRVQSNKKMLWKVAEKLKSFCKYFHGILTNKIWKFYIVIIRRQINLQSHTESLHTIHVWSSSNLYCRLTQSLRANCMGLCMVDQYAYLCYWRVLHPSIHKPLLPWTQFTYPGTNRFCGSFGTIETSHGNEQVLTSPE